MNNPWKVNSLQAFHEIFLKCPECAFNTKEEAFFRDHAIKNHPLSLVLFGKSKEATNRQLEDDFGFDLDDDCPEIFFSGNVEPMQEGFYPMRPQTQPVRPTQMGSHQMKPQQMGPQQTGPHQMGPPQMGPQQMGPHHMRPQTQPMRPTQIGPQQMRSQQQMGPQMNKSIETIINENISNANTSQKWANWQNTPPKTPQTPKTTALCKGNPYKKHYDCKECEFVCTSRETMNRHIARIHSSSSNLYFHCNICSHVFGSQLGKAIKSCPLLRPFGGSEFWGFSLLKI